MGNQTVYSQGGSVCIYNKMPECLFENNGLIFAGWNTKADGSGIFIPDGGSAATPGVLPTGNTAATFNKTVNIYAQWRDPNLSVLKDGEDAGTLKLYSSEDGFKSPVAEETDGGIVYDTKSGVDYKLVCEFSSEAEGKLYEAKGVLVDGEYVREYTFPGGSATTQTITYNVVKNPTYAIATVAYKVASAESEVVEDDIWTAESEPPLPSNAIVISGTPDDPATGKYLSGSTFSVTVNLPAGYKVQSVAIFEGETSKQSGTALQYDDIEVSGEMSVRVVFYTATYSLTAREATGQTDMFSEVSVFPAEVRYNESATFTAVLNTGYRFRGWYRNGEKIEGAEATYTVNVTEDMDLVAFAEPLQYRFAAAKASDEVSTAAISSATVNDAASVEIDHGSRVVFSATITDTNTYAFKGWFDNAAGTGEAVSENATYEVSATGPLTLYAVAEYREYTVSVVKDDGDGGVASVSFQISRSQATSGSQVSYGSLPVVNTTAHYGDSVVFTATLNEGYDFVGWYLDGAQISTSATYAHTVQGDVEFLATSKKKKYRVIASKTLPEGSADSDALTLQMYRSDENGTQGDAIAGVSVEVEHGDWILFKSDVASGYEKKYYADADDLYANGKWKWKLDGEIVPHEDGNDRLTSDGSFLLQITANHTVSATMAWRDYYLTVGAGDGVASVSVDVNGNAITLEADSFVAHYGDIIKLTATCGTETPYFYGWGESEEDIVSGDNPYEFYLTEGLTLAAFAGTTPAQFQTVAISGDERYPLAFLNLTVNGNSQRVKIRGGNTVTVLYELMAGYEILRWEDGNGTQIIPATEENGKFTWAPPPDAESVQIRAVLRQFFYLYISTAEGSEGAFTGFKVDNKPYIPGGVIVGDSTIVEAQMNEHWNFGSWSFNGKTVDNPKITITPVSETLYVTAAAKKKIYDISASYDTLGISSVSMSAAKATAGDVVEFVANVNPGYAFDGWYSGDTRISGDAVYSHTVAGDIALVGRASVIKYTVSVAANPSDAFSSVGIANPSADGEYNYGATISLQAVLENGWKFAGWSVNTGALLPSDAANPSFKTAVSGAATYTANAKKEVVATVALMNKDVDGGTVSIGDGEEAATSATVYEGDFFTIVATPKTGYRFAGWYSAESTDDEYLVSKTATATKQAGTKDMKFFAVFVSGVAADVDLYVWEGSDENMTAVWRSKTYAASKPFNPSACRVDALGYSPDKTLELTVDMFSSPDVAAKSTGTTTLKNIENQNARRLPVRRMERYMQIEVKANVEIDTVLVGTSMGGLAI